MYNFRANIAVLMNITPDHLGPLRPLYAEVCGRQIPHHPKPDSGRCFHLLERRPHHPRELDKHGFKPIYYPFAAVKEDGAIAYVEDGEVEINEPIAFNMEQEELALQEPTTCTTHWLPASLPTLQVSAKNISAKPCPTSREWNTGWKK